MINKEAICLIKHYESLNDGDLTHIGLQPKNDCLGYPTVGYGHKLTKADGHKYDNITEQQADDLLARDLEHFEQQVRSMVYIKLTDNQLGALVSFAYNVGVTALKNSMLLQKLNNKYLSGAAIEFLKLNKGTVKGQKVILKGLTLRRESEQVLFLKA